MIVQHSDGFDYMVKIYYPVHNKVTQCDIYRVESGGSFRNRGVYITSGKASLDTRDRFVKKTGRKIAITKALESIDDKELRSAIWNEYFVKTNEKRALCAC